MKHLLTAILLLLAAPLQARQCPRIISQSPYITHSLQWLGLAQCIVGVSRYDTLDLPRTGGIFDPDKEAIDSLMADIIFTSDWISAADMAKATPPGVRFYRLAGFDSLAEISDNLLLIGRAVGQKNIRDKVKRFQAQLQKQLRQINGRHKKALLLSSCSGTPYSFGKHTWLYELFGQMGFTMVEKHDKIRHLKPGNEIEDISHLLDSLRPDLLFIFERKLNAKCRLILPQTPVRIVSLDGEYFLHPAPVLLKGLQQLADKQRLWD